MYNYYQQQNSAIAPKMNYGGFLKGHPVSSCDFYLKIVNFYVIIKDYNFIFL